MGFMLRVRLASFFAGAAAAAAGGGYFLYKDYKLAHDSTALQVRSLLLPSDLGFDTSHISSKAKPRFSAAPRVRGNGD